MCCVHGRGNHGMSWHIDGELHEASMNEALITI